MIMITIRKAACGEEQHVLDFYYALIDDMKNATYPSFSERINLKQRETWSRPTNKSADLNDRRF